MKTLSVLIVEDDDSIRESLADFMIAENYPFRTAIDGLDAIELLEKNDFNPTVIILDLNMPRLSGKDFLLERKRLALAPDACVLMLSATPAIPIEGVKAWVQKPIELQVLQDLIEKYG